MKIKELRIAKGVSQKQIADALGVTSMAYNYWENEKREPSFADVKRLAEYFGVSVAELFGEEPNYLPVEAPKPKIFHECNVYHTSASLEEIEQSIEEDKEKLKETFFQIGYKLTIIKNCELYKRLGYQNIVEYAQERFGFGKTTAYDLLNVYEQTRDSSKPNQIAKEYKKYSQSQLVAMGGSNWASGDLPKYIEPDDTVEDIKEYVKLWNKSYSKNQTKPEGDCLKQALVIESAKKQALAQEKIQKETVAPGQIEIDVDTSECIGEETFNFNQAYEQPDYDEEEYENEEESTSQDDPIVQEPTKASSFEIYPTKKFVSTPARLKEALKNFFDQHKDIQVYYDPLKNGGLLMTPKDFVDRLTSHLLSKWDEIFKDSGMGIEK